MKWDEERVERDRCKIVRYKIQLKMEAGADKRKEFYISCKTIEWEREKNRREIANRNKTESTLKFIIIDPRWDPHGVIRTSLL